MEFDTASVHEDNNPTNAERPNDDPCDLVDIAPVPEAYLADPGDAVDQSKVLENIIAARLNDPADVDPFQERRVFKLTLSKLRKLYEDKDPEAVRILDNRHKISIDKEFKLEFGNRQIFLDTSQTMIDYQLVVANSIGLEILLPNADNDHRFNFEMNLK